MNSALVIIRLVMGSAMAAHGAQKLFGWFGGEGVQRIGAFMESIGFRPGTRFAILAGLSEFLGGILLVLGLLNPVGPALMIAVMLVAALTFHRGHGFFNLKGGAEIPVLYITGALVVALAGPGRYSVDHVLGLDQAIPRTVTWFAMALSVFGALGNVAMRDTNEPHRDPPGTGQ